MKKHIKKMFFIILAIAVFCTVSMVIIYNYIESVGEQLTIDIDEVGEADCILVLGAGIVGNRPSLSLANRLDRAVEVYENSSITKIIVSGDHGKKNYDEVNVMRDYLIECGISKENIFMDHAGFSTYESIYRARDVFDVKSAVIVTQKLHLARALYIAAALGVEGKGIAAQNSTTASTLQQRIREYPARFKAFIQCTILHSKPKYLGEVIPISGSGEITEG